MRSLRHPHIVSYYGCHWADDHLHMYLELEYMAGGSLAQVLSNFGPLEESLIERHTQQLLPGLEYLHTQNPYILHRDVKGANVLVGLDSLAKLADFGCSKRAEETTFVTIEGSIPWMAPEVLTHSRYGRAGDIWSFGCLVMEMATADSPWGHFDNLMAAILKIGLFGELPPIPVCFNAAEYTPPGPGERGCRCKVQNETKGRDERLGRELALRGITVIVASGDNGNSAVGTDCDVLPDLVGTSPWVTSVGATMPSLESQPYCAARSFQDQFGECVEPGQVVCSTSEGALITSSGYFSIYRSRPRYQDRMRQQLPVVDEGCMAVTSKEVMASSSHA
ncbi:mkkA [Symbiodinium microadriaticum]|nr:mkkA [Symbiodinium microadriaticum]